jgi:hypothetical protein
MGEKIRSEVVSRRTVLPLLGLAVTFSLGVPMRLMVPNAKAEDAAEKKGDTAGEKKSVTEPGQERRQGFWERRRERRKLLRRRRELRLERARRRRQRHMEQRMEQRSHLRRNRERREMLRRTHEERNEIRRRGGKEGHD